MIVHYSSPNKIVANNIKKIRLLKKMSGSELADKLDYSQQHVSRIELGLVNFNLIQIISIATALEVEIYDLISGLGYQKDSLQELSEYEFFYTSESIVHRD